jgi:hypothetical protein
LSELNISKNSCTGVFGLNGYDENSATYALGWVLSKSQNLLRSFITSSIGNNTSIDLKNVTIDLQKHGPDKGFTDLEIKQEGVFHIIVEAKKLWSLPIKRQLSKYTSRFSLSGHSSENERQVLVTLSAASIEYAERRQASEVDAFPVVHYSWTDLNNIVSEARTKTNSYEEKLWLRELTAHLKGYITMTSPTDNRAYCVVISSGTIGTNSSYTWLDVINKESHYFHPVGGNGWPVSPPNYVAFRTDGNLMSVHHVDSYEVTDDLKLINKNWPSVSEDHFVYNLGPAMKPTQPLKNGGIYPSGRIWCALDTLLSGAFETIAEARDETQRRDS